MIVNMESPGNLHCLRKARDKKEEREAKERIDAHDSIIVCLSECLAIDCYYE